MSTEGHRRDFFTKGLGWLVQNALGDGLGLGSSETLKARPTGPRMLLRPPGALPEMEFLSTCARCGECVKACPAKAIFPWASGDAATDQTPVIDARVSPCVVCDDLSCMKVCASGALVLAATRADIDMGLAEVDIETCVRTQGEDCTTCIDRCPLGPAAIRLDGAGRVEVDRMGCVGCGVCQWVCPTEPEAIRVNSERNLKR